MHTIREDAMTADTHCPRPTSAAERSASTRLPPRRFAGGRSSPPLLAATVLWALCTGLSTTACLASEWRYAMDDNPKQIAPNAWSFSINLGVRPAGQMRFCAAEYDFAGPTRGIAVDYVFDGPGIDWFDGRVFYAIGPTLFDQLDGFINGGSPDDMRGGVFSGVVYATAPLTAVHFVIEADRLMPVRRRH